VPFEASAEPKPQAKGKKPLPKKPAGKSRF